MSKQVTASDLRNAREERRKAALKSADSNSVSAPTTPIVPVVPPSMQGKAEEPKKEEAPKAAKDGTDAPKSSETSEKSESKSEKSPEPKNAPKDDEGGSKSSEKAEDCGPSGKPTMASVITASIVDPTQVALDANIEGVLFNEHTASPHWLITANGEPVAKLPHTSFSMWNEPNGPGYFKSPQFFGNVKKACKVEPLQIVLGKLGAQPYVAKVAATQAHKELSDKAVKTASAKFAVERGQILDTFKNTFLLVAEAQEKNYLPTNPLKHALFASLTAAGMVNPGPAIEEAFKEASAANFEAMCTQAETWMGYSPEAQEDVRRQIQGTQHRAPVARAASGSGIPFNSQRDGAAPDARNNVNLAPRSEPLQRQAAASGDTDVQTVKQTLGLGARARLTRATGG